MRPRSCCISEGIPTLSLCEDDNFEDNKDPFIVDTRYRMESYFSVIIALKAFTLTPRSMGVFEDEHEMNIVEEMCSGGSLTELLKKRGGHLSEREAIKAMKAVVEVVAHCHSMGVLYR